MSRRHDPRRAEHHVNEVIAAEVGDGPEWARLDDDRLMPGVGVDGRPAEIDGSDRCLKVARAACWCGTPLAIVLHFDRSSRGMPSLYVVEAQVIEDRGARPVTMRRYRRMLTDESVTADCAAHGRQAIVGRALLRLAMKVTRRLQSGEARPGMKGQTYTVARNGA